MRLNKNNRVPRHFTSAIGKIFTFERSLRCSNSIDYYGQKHPQNFRAVRNRRQTGIIKRNIWWIEPRAPYRTHGSPAFTNLRYTAYDETVALLTAESVSGESDAFRPRSGRANCRAADSDDITSDQMYELVLLDWPKKFVEKIINKSNESLVNSIGLAISSKWGGLARKEIVVSGKSVIDVERNDLMVRYCDIGLIIAPYTRSWGNRITRNIQIRANVNRISFLLFLRLILSLEEF